MKEEKLQTEINQIQFYNCEEIEMGDVLHYLITGQLLGKCRWKTAIKAYVSMVVRIACSRSYKIESNGTPKTIFLFSNSYRGREDHKRAFLAAAELVDKDYATMVCDKRRLRLCGLKYFICLIRWNRQLKSVVPQFDKRIAFVSAIFQAYMDYEEMMEACKNFGWEIGNLVVHCDVMPVDCFFVQKFNHIGKTTVTLQHGTYIREKDEWPMKKSKSRYFFAESQYAEECAKDCGYCGRVITVGSPHHIGLDVNKKLELKRIKIIGVFLDGEGTKSQVIQDNIKMIQIVQEYSKKNSKNILLKYHPSNHKRYYEKYIDTKVTTVCPAEMMADEVGNMADLAIMSKSTVFLTMLKLWKPVLIYRSKDENLKFYLKDEISFSDIHTFEKKIQRMSTEEYKQKINQCRDYYLAPGCIEENYKMAFRKIGIIN